MSADVKASPVEGTVIRPEGATLAAQKKCANWLSFCLGEGWGRENLDELEALWWRFRDKNGNLKPHNAAVHGRGPE